MSEYERKLYGLSSDQVRRARKRRDTLRNYWEYPRFYTELAEAWGLTTLQVRSVFAAPIKVKPKTPRPSIMFKAGEELSDRAKPRTQQEWDVWQATYRPGKVIW